ncbi:hypothetical protein [Amycolatopsis alkalitolerans]|uniref:Uncharacterized protein n=1 Tax=Amycolatopsis alkalitolerans TaxID=2547244 RepID=A0A5C4LPZ9_9PSEU|nr:hypothetical protein [Amycolatopsis alkalitolerans]TNC20076.1 hypothetical protein FG385_31615 [Amycolatopsis alkalitolerans]
MTFDTGLLDAVIDSIEDPLAEQQHAAHDAAQEATNDLLWLGCHLLSRGERTLAVNGLERRDLKAAVRTAEALVVGQTPGPVPDPCLIIEAQLDQLGAVRAAIVDSAAKLDRNTPSYAAVLASLDTVIAAATSLHRLLDLTPEVLRD